MIEPQNQPLDEMYFSKIHEGDYAGEFSEKSITDQKDMESIPFYSVFYADSEYSVSFP